MIEPPRAVIAKTNIGHGRLLIWTSTYGKDLMSNECYIGSSGQCEGAISYDLSLGEAFANNRRECLKWHAREVRSKQSYVQAYQRMPICPCSLWLMWWDPRFSFWDYSVDGDSYMIPNFPSRRRGYGQNGKVG